MIKKITVDNFKCFDHLETELGTLNLFTGINGMGKSTIIQTLLLFRQTFEKYKSLNMNPLVMNGKYINLGKIDDILYWNRVEDCLKIKIDGTKIDCCYTYRGDVELGHIEAEYKSKNISLREGLLGTGFEYISADRMGPRRYYDVLNIDNEGYRKVGPSGEGALSYLDSKGIDFQIYENVRNVSEVSRRLDLQVNAWISEISPGLNVCAIPFTEAQLMALKYETKTPLGVEYTNAINMGFGVSYILPIIVCLLKAQKGDLIIIENPEAHLHPKGQRRIGELVALVASNGVQVIIETHSDHVLNGIRLSVKNNILKTEDVRLNYFYQYYDNNGYPRHTKTSPHILPNGSLSNWPEGFFDEWDKAVDDLLF